jgi:hypothetical protein
MTATAAAPPRSAPPPPLPPPTARPRAELTEAEFLEIEAADAKAALRQSWRDLKHNLREASDLRTWAKRYPLPTLGAAAGAGFVAGLAIGKPTPAARERDAAENRRKKAKRSRFANRAVAALVSAAASSVGALLRDSRT